MNARNRWIVISITIIVILMLTAFASPVRGIVRNGRPGGFVSMPWGSLIDSDTGFEYGVTLVGRESEDTVGAGNITLQVIGPGIWVCSTHGGSVDIGPWPEDGENFGGGSFPLQEIQCGTAYGMAVSIEGCTVKAELHGFAHSDYPLTIYTGPNTVELTLKKNASGSNHINMKVHTPRDAIKLSGNIGGDIEMDTCP